MLRIHSVSYVCQNKLFIGECTSLRLIYNDFKATLTKQTQQPYVRTNGVDIMAQSNMPLEINE